MKKYARKCNWCKKELLEVENQYCFEGAVNKTKWIDYRFCVVCSKKLRKVYLNLLKETPNT
jgi:hypothetical protein